MRRVIVLPVRVADDVALARYAVQAAHGMAGALVVLDVSDPAGIHGVDLAGLIHEMESTTEGNGQRLALLGVPPPEGSTKAAWFSNLADCLDDVAPALDRAFEIEISLPARLEYLAPVRKHLAGVVRKLHCDADAFQVEILVDELCLNAVENSPSSHNSYDLRFRCEGHELHVEVTNLFDDSLDSERIMNRRLQSFDDSGGYLGERGRGLFLIARIADGLQIRSVDRERIRVSVTKRLRGGAPDPPPASGA